MFILCPFFLNGILVFTSVSGNRTLSGRVTSSETIRCCSFESGARISCRFLNRLKFLSVGAISHRFVQIPYRSISGEVVLQSPISARNSASNGATSWNLNSSGFACVGTDAQPSFVRICRERVYGSAVQSVGRVGDVKSFPVLIAVRIPVGGTTLQHAHRSFRGRFRRWPARETAPRSRPATRSRHSPAVRTIR